MRPPCDYCGSKKQACATYARARGCFWFADDLDTPIDTLIARAMERRQQTEKPMNITATLRNATRRSGKEAILPWRPYDHLSGDIYGDTRGRFADGERVSTSEIMAVLNGDVFVTRNSTYKVESWAGAKPANDDAPGADELLLREIKPGQPYPITVARSRDRYPAPIKAELVTFWRKDGGVVMSVVANGAVTDYAIPTNVLAAGARYAIEKLEEMAA